MNRGILYMLGVVGLWSIIPILTKVVLREIDPFSLAFLRLLQGTAVLLLVYGLRGGRWRELSPLNPWVFLGGVGIGLNYCLFSWSLSLTTASAGVLIVQAQLVTWVLLAALFLGERLTLRRVGGMLAVIGGVVLIVRGRGPLGPLFHSQYTAGNGLMLLAGIAWGVYATANQALSPNRGSLRTLIPLLGLGAVVAAPAAALRLEPRPMLSLSALVGIVILGCLGTGGAFYLLSEGIRHLSTALAGAMTSLSPLLSVLLAHLILHEALPATVFMAAVLIVGGISLIVRAEHRGSAAPRWAAGGRSRRRKIVPP
jgi:drug/metabolite transporter (DMT)-like permease